MLPYDRREWLCNDDASLEVAFCAPSECDARRAACARARARSSSQKSSRRTGKSQYAVSIFRARDVSNYPSASSDGDRRGEELKSY